jgi:hypothetical protein
VLPRACRGRPAWWPTFPRRAGDFAHLMEGKRPRASPCSSDSKPPVASGDSRGRPRVIFRRPDELPFCRSWPPPSPSRIRWA